MPALGKHSNLRKERHSVGTLLTFAVVFTGLGLFFLLDFGLIPLVQVVRSRSWTAVPAVVTESFAEPYGRGGRVCIRFEYVWKNRKRQGNCYDFFLSRRSYGGGGSTREKVIKSHTVGKRIECLVNQDDPAESVVSRAIPWCAWTGMLPLVFVIIGISVGWQSVRTIRAKLKHPARRKVKLRK